jgi:nucleoside-diphosphate-sugar epimerase
MARTALSDRASSDRDHGRRGRDARRGRARRARRLQRGGQRPAPVSEWLPYLAEVAGAKPPLRVPAWLGRPLAGEFAVAQMTTSRGYSNEKARKELGWEPRFASWREGFRAWVSG